MSMVVWVLFAVLGFIAVILFLTENYYKGDNPFDHERHNRRFHYDRRDYNNRND
ncbi:MAG: hypothetical protein SFU91_04690 [Chloroherpetonaceae bacterium]|nr:hypothetical protein [Chloroherpetonaceae bacterium]